MMITTRFAPSPTGFLHLGGARTALFSWAYAQKEHGEFILRIEDTDIQRSNQESVNSIIDAMQWLGLHYTSGPFYQTQRLERYKQVVQQMLHDGSAYYCYCSKTMLDDMRQTQQQQGLKPKYNQHCLHNPPLTPPHNQPVVRFKNPTTGSVAWVDLIKGHIQVNNSELDDLIIARMDGSPTYNFCVVIDDFDMKITHVIRGDDHVNNTPRQINILHSLNAKIPYYAHVPMILSADGTKMSKRKDAVSVMEYKSMGILPDALLNYLARLCWGHGNDEIFSLKQFIEWFQLEKVSSSPARFDLQKLLWVNAQHIKSTPNDKLAQLVKEYWHTNHSDIPSPKGNLAHMSLIDIVDLVKPRVNSINNLAWHCSYFYQPHIIDDTLFHQVFTPEALDLIAQLKQHLLVLDLWDIATLKYTLQDFCKIQNIPFSKIGGILRLKLCGSKDTPSIDQIMLLLGQPEVISRLSQ